MKKLFILCAIAALLIGCKSPNTPTPVQSVTFNVFAFSQSTEPLPGPHRASILDDMGGTALTDLYVFDGTDQLAHQTSTQDDFGTVTLNLTHGDHNLSFVCSRSTGLNYTDGVLSCTSLRSTFGKRFALNVTSNTLAQDILQKEFTIIKKFISKIIKNLHISKFLVTFASIFETESYGKEIAYHQMAIFQSQTLRHVTRQGDHLATLSLEKSK